jgi:nicotinate phosphoribosyltransferase
MERNLSLLTDFYELTMSKGYFNNRMEKQIAYYDMFFRKVPDNGGFAIMAGVEQLIEYIENLKFSKEDIEYLKSRDIFDKDFIEYLENFKFTCDIWAVEEGTVIFPNEPIITVRGPIIEAQLIETMVLLTINHQSLIATKACRIKRSFKDASFMDFGTRRAQGVDGAMYGARAAYIGGADSTSCTIAGKKFGIPVVGTMAHSWVQSFESEYEAFKTYAKEFPESCVLLVDTYSVLKSGLPNAIKVFDEVLAKNGFRPKGIRIDSGDLAYLSKEARKILDNAGYSDCKIVASNSLDEYLIRDLEFQGAKIDVYGVGERLITAKSDPVFGGVYKLVAIEKNDKLISKIKLSENVSKIITPGFKSLYRLFSKSNNKAIADLITLNNEKINDKIPYELFDPNNPWKRKLIKNFYVKDLRKQIYSTGKLIYSKRKLKDIKENCNISVYSLWDEVLRFENPHKYYVDLSLDLWNLKNQLITSYSKEV